MAYPMKKSPIQGTEEQEFVLLMTTYRSNKSETTKPNGRAYDNAYGIIRELRYKKVFEDISKLELDNHRALLSSHRV